MSSKYNIFSILFLLFFGLCSCKSAKSVNYKNVEQNENVLIFNDQTVYNPCEPSIAIDKNNPSIVVAGSVLDNVHRSTDGGKTWSSYRLTSSHGVYGDPVLSSDNFGSFYYCHLADPEGKGWASKRLLESIVVHRSDDGGKTWNNGVAIGANHPKDQDKEWLSADPYSGRLYISWTEFDVYNSPKEKDETRIRFSSSRDKGETWTEPITISTIPGNCLDDDNTVEGATPVAGKDGRVFVAWAGHENIYFNRSMDYGKSWLKKEKIIARQPGGWVLPIEGIKRVNGMPVTQVDQSGGIFDGRLYVMWADQRDGKADTDIFIKYSDDDGETWSNDIQVNNDENERQQFFPWIAIDQSSGYLYVVYYNRNNHSDYKIDVSLARSYDGGKSWQEEVISEKPFNTPPEFIFFGDYNNISAVDGHIRPIWTRYDNGKLSIWTALILEQHTSSSH